MKSSLAKKLDVTIIAAFLGFASVMVAQPAAAPLDVQGLDQFSISGIRSRAMGGTGTANAMDASALFSNPAALSRLSSLEVRGGGIFVAANREQTQEWVPMRPIPGLSVLFEGLTGNIKKPDSLGIAGLPLSPWSMLQTQYDDVRPNWTRNSTRTQPLSLAAAMPLTLGGMKIAAGIGVAQMIDLDQYYQNNNSMTPYLGQQRPDPQLITNRTDTLHVKWYQYSRSREGAVSGITPGVSLTVLPGLRIGASAAFLTGTSDDVERRVERGHLNVAIANGVGANFMVDTVYYHQIKTGTSTYSGNALTFGLHFQQQRYSIGLTVKPSMTLTRKWDRDVVSMDTTRKSFPIRIDSLMARSYHESGSEDLKFPFSYSIGLVLTPTDRWTVAFDYELRNLSDAEVTSSSYGVPTHPWTSNKGALRLGVEYLAGDMLALRGGYREDIQAFSPDGSAIADEPARGGIYSAGAGFTLGNILIDVAYEYSLLKYEDIYQSNVNFNTREQHQFMMEFAYRF
jgi:long-subunit fatty acid transport protein